jgi:Uma2 family endonuclease
MATMTAMPRGAQDWTVDDLDRLPDDGLQYELLDGLLLVTPAPVPLHQRAIRQLLLLLEAACPPSMEVFFSPLDWRPDRFTSLQPDLLVVRNEDVGAKNVTEPLELAVEVLSPSTRRKDEVLKHSKYRDAGVRSYWVVDPDPTTPTLTAFDLVDGRYVVAVQGTGDETVLVRRPFEVEITPARLVRR